MNFHTCLSTSFQAKIQYVSSITQCILINSLMCGQLSQIAFVLTVGGPDISRTLEPGGVNTMCFKMFTCKKKDVIVSSVVWWAPDPGRLALPLTSYGPQVRLFSSLTLHHFLIYKVIMIMSILIMIITIIIPILYSYEDLMKEMVVAKTS